MSDARAVRWRLILGEGSEKLGELSGVDGRRAASLDFLYDRETVDLLGGDGPSQLTVPTWINEISELFPRAVQERIQTDALERYGLSELVTDPEVLERIEPSETLLKAVLSTKHLMNQEVLAAAKQIVRKVVQQLVELFATDVRRAVTGRLDPHRRSRHKAATNFDPVATIRANLKRWSPELGKLVIADPVFVSRTKRHSERWQIIIAVDQSGSMLDSVIHSAVTASIFHGIPVLRSHLLAFDTEVVDLSSEVIDPVETLMQVQLGGGTDIHRAVRYAEQLVDTPRRAMVVVVTDLYEGGSVFQLKAAVRRLVSEGVRVLILGALDASGTASYDMTLGRELAELGAQVGVMTPFELAAWVGEAMR